MDDYDVFRKHVAGSALHSRLGHITSDILIALDKTRVSPSSVWLCHSKFTHVERYRVFTAVVITCCAASLLGWVSPSIRVVIFRLFFTFLASFPLSVWLEREYTYRRRLDERLEAIQHHVALNPAVLAVVAGVRYSLPIVARAIPVNPDMLGQSDMEGFVRRAIPERNTGNMSEEQKFGLSDGDAKHHARQPGPGIEPPIPTNPPPIRLASSPPHPLSSTPYNNPPYPTLYNNPFNLTPSNNPLNPTPHSGPNSSSRKKLVGRVKNWFR